MSLAALISRPKSLGRQQEGRGASLSKAAGGSRETQLKMPHTKLDKMEPESVFLPKESLTKESHVPSMAKYREMYRKSVEEPEKFWVEMAKELHWDVPPKEETALSYNFDARNGPIFVKWMEGAKINVSYNLLDRNIAKGLGDTVAFFWEGNDPADEDKITYSELLREVCKFANVLKSKGVKKGDRVTIYMPMILEIVVAMLACTRIGAVHTVVFAGFSADSMAERILNMASKIVVTTDGNWRGEKLIPLKELCDQALDICQKRGHKVDTCIVVRHLPRLQASRGSGKRKLDGATLPSAAKRRGYDHSKEALWTEGKYFWWHELMEKAEDTCPPEWVDAEDPFFIMYTSGSTGVPKGVLHTTGGYLLYAATTFKYVFDYHHGEIFWGPADIGWITGHTFVVYGPLVNGATSILFEGTPFHPHPGRYWEVIEKYQVNKFYTAPTAVRSLMKFGDEPLKKYNRESLHILGTMGEPINPSAWLWYYKKVGKGKCSIVDTFWQTESGGPMLTPLPGCTPTKPGSACFPFFGVLAAILDEKGKEVEGPGEGKLAFKRPWPGMARTIWENHDRYESTYFRQFPGCYFTGDGVRRDEDGYLWVTGRVDDMLNVSGHLLSTSQVESALVEHRAVAEAAVVPIPHPIKGECVYCYVTLRDGLEFTSRLVHELKLKVRERIGAFASPDFVHHAPALPKTRSGKIMRRILRKIARNEHDLGDLTSLADETVIQTLLDNRQ